jgi:pimeloyl-ACP methyl ester carboxylesterase
MTERPMMRSNDPGFDIEAVLPSLTAKALILDSMDDEQCPVANSQRMAELWPGSELVLLDNLGHRLIAQDPDVVARVFEFVDAM